MSGMGMAARVPDTPLLRVTQNMLIALNLFNGRTAHYQPPNFPCTIRYRIMCNLVVIHLSTEHSAYLHSLSAPSSRTQQTRPTTTLHWNHYHYPLYTSQHHPPNLQR